MSVGGLFNTGTSALRAAYAQLQTTGHNIANVNTPGYSRQEVELATAGGNISGGGWIGRGVDAVTVSRRYDRFLQAEVIGGTAASASDKVRYEQLGTLDRMFASTENGIGAAIDDLTSGFADLVNRPFDSTARSVVVNRARTLAERISNSFDNLDQMRENVNQRLMQDVHSLNASLAQLGAINDRIAKTAGTGQPPNDLLDQRDALVEKINQTLKTTQYVNADGTVSLFSASGQAMVVGNTVATFELRNDELDPSRLQLAMTTSGNSIALPRGMLGGGEIEGLIRFRDDDLAAAQARLGQLAGALAEAYNTQQSLGRDPSGAAGAPLFGYGTASVGPASTNTGSAAFSVAVSSGSQLQASDYEIDYNGGAYSITRMSDGTTTSISSWPATIDGLTLNLSGGTAQNGDRFLVKSGSAFASDFRAVISSGARIASGLAVSTQLGQANTGDIQVDAFSVTSNDANLSQPVTITFDGAGHYSVSGTGTGNPSGLAYTPGMTISYNGWSVRLDGSPGANDTLDLVPTPNPANDNRNARALVELADQRTVAGDRFSDAFAQMLSDIGVRTQSAQSANTMSAQVLSDAKAARSSVSGVNLDEEAARLLQYQQAYQAAAKLLATAQTVFQTLLDASSL